jgi:uncharacterized membrane protein (DUF485 family)
MSTSYDWQEIERLPEFQELVRSRRRFSYTAGATGIGFGALYVVLAATAPGLTGTHVAGSFSLGFAGGVALVVMTWAITWMYMRRSNAVWGPLEARVRERAAGLAAQTAPVAEAAPGVERDGRLGRRETPRGSEAPPAARATTTTTNPQEA